MAKGKTIKDSVLARWSVLFLAFMLKKADREQGYGLELPNIENE